MQNAKSLGAGVLGAHSLTYLGLSAVLQPGNRVYSLFAGRWFGLW